MISPCVHFPAQIHSGDAALRQAVQHRPLIGSAAPVLGKQAGVNVDAAQSRHIQHLLGQNPAVGNHRADIRFQCPQGLHRLLFPEIFRLEYGDVCAQCHLLHGRGHQLHAPTLGTVGLGIDADHLKAVGQNLFQAGRRNVRRAHKHNSQGFSPLSDYSSSWASSSSSVRNRSMTSV